MRQLYSPVLLGMSLHAAVWAVDVPMPETVVRNASREVLEVVRKEKLTFRDKRFKDLIESRALSNFDFARMTALAVGKGWRDANELQRSLLVREFRTLLVRTYSMALSAQSIKDIEVKPVRLVEGDNDVVVHTEVETSSGQTFPIDYRMIHIGNTWRACDISVEGVSLVSTYRTSFNQTIEKEGIEGLIRQLQARNAAARQKGKPNNADDTP
ncbi:ABC transporter substrate-binding protein [Burkholderiaceae bacterium DAT-1]|nr:ABC transporter substrate-binding protein [Burkholderiaceae bacterium DAT-1]